MELEQFIVGRVVVRKRVIPTTAIPPPIDPRVIQPVADVRRVTWLARIGIVDQETLGGGSAGRKRRQQRLRGVDRVFAVDCKLVVRQDLVYTIVARLQTRRDRSNPRRASRCYQPLVIQEGTAVGRVEKIVP